MNTILKNWIEEEVTNRLRALWVGQIGEVINQAFVIHDKANYRVVDVRYQIFDESVSESEFSYYEITSMYIEVELETLKLKKRRIERISIDSTMPTIKALAKGMI